MKKQNIKRKHENVLQVYDEDFKSTKKEKKKNWIDKICLVTEKIGISIRNLSVLFLALAFIGVVAWWASMGESGNPSVKKALKNRYGQSFVIVSKNVDEKGNGTYIVYPKGYKEYKFVVTKNKRSIKEDYKNMVIKTYWSNISDKQKEEMKLVEAENRMDIKIEEYSQMEVVLAQYYNLYKKSLKKLPGNITLNTQLKFGDYTGYISVNDKEKMEDYIIRMKYNYFNYLIERKKDTSHIPQNEIESIWTPEELTLIVNGNVIKKEVSCACYWISEKEYMVSYLKPLTKYIEDFEFIGTTWFGMGNQKFRYKDKKFTLNYIVTETKLKKYLDADIKIDIENRTMELNIK